jgi:hypothetical protein
MTFSSGLLQSSIPATYSEFSLGHQMSTLSPFSNISKVARGRIKAGYGTFVVPSYGSSGTSLLDPGEVYQIPDPGASADVDAIITSITSSTGVQTFSGSDLDGVVGAAEMQPARNITLVLSNNADWDATNATLVGINQLGQSVTETLAIPNGGNGTVTSANTYISVTSLSIPAQSGTGGTATVGVSALTTLTIAHFRGVAIRRPVKTTVASTGLYGYPGITSTTVTCDFVDGEPVGLLRAGEIIVYGEEALTEGDALYVRIASGSGGSDLGAFRNDSDSSTCVLIPGATVMRNSTAAGPAWVFLPHYVGA